MSDNGSDNTMVPGTGMFGPHITWDQSAKLLAQFPAEQVGKLPRVSCKACRDASGGACDRHTKSKCETCKAYITNAHVHLDYVGHAAVTKRLLEVDPLWRWEPLAFSEDGLPLIKRDGSDSILWVKMTVCGVTRLGVGIAHGVELEKQLISDAIRNAAMRFGVAVDLWSKEDLRDHDEEQQGAPEPEPTIPPSAQADLLGRLTTLGDSPEAQAQARKAWKAAKLPDKAHLSQLKRADLPLAQRILDAAEAKVRKQRAQEVEGAVQVASGPSDARDARAQPRAEAPSTPSGEHAAPAASPTAPAGAAPTPVEEVAAK